MPTSTGSEGCTASGPAILLAPPKVPRYQPWRKGCLPPTSVMSSLSEDTQCCTWPIRRTSVAPGEPQQARCLRLSEFKEKIVWSSANDTLAWGSKRWETDELLVPSRG